MMHTPFDEDPDMQNPSAFYNEPIDSQESEAILRRNRPPAGTYRTDPEELGEMADTPTTYEDGRRSTRFFGKARRVVRQGEAVVQTLRFSISKDARPKRDGDGQPIEGKDDSSTVLFAQAVAAYGQTRGEAPKSLGDVVDFLKTGVYDLVTFAGTDGLVVKSIRACPTR